MASPLEVPIQRIRAFVQDHILEPDAMRGSEHFLRNIQDSDGNAITPVDEEEARRQFAAEAIQSRAPIRVQSSASMSSPSETTPPAVPVSEAPPSSPNVMRAPIGAGTVAPVVTDPGVDWQAKARAEGWLPRGEQTEERSAYKAPSGPPVDPKYQAPYMSPTGAPAEPPSLESERVAPPTMTPVPNAVEGASVPESAPPPALASGAGTSEV